MATPDSTPQKSIIEGSGLNNIVQSWRVFKEANPDIARAVQVKVDLTPDSKPRSLDYYVGINVGLFLMAELDPSLSWDDTPKSEMYRGLLAYTTYQMTNPDVYPKEMTNPDLNLQ